MFIVMFQHVCLYLQFQEMMGQYEENLQNERIEKKRMSEDYESKIGGLQRVRNLLGWFMYIASLCLTFGNMI